MPKPSLQNLFTTDREQKAARLAMLLHERLPLDPVELAAGPVVDLAPMVDEVEREWVVRPFPKPGRNGDSS